MLHLLPWLGGDYLHYLLERPGQPRPAVEVVCRAAFDTFDRKMATGEAAESGLKASKTLLLSPIGEVADWEAVAAYRKEAAEIMEALAEARAENNTVMVEQHEGDLAIIAVKVRGYPNSGIGIRSEGLVGCVG